MNLTNRSPFSCVFPVIDHEFRHDIVKEADYFDNVVTKFVVNNRTGALKTGIILLFTNCQNVRSRLSRYRINYKFMCLSAY